jgi:hypothetical protein
LFVKVYRQLLGTEKRFDGQELIARCLVVETTRSTPHQWVSDQGASPRTKRPDFYLHRKSGIALK